MMKIALPVLLAGIVMIAGIFAFMPVDKATTVHTTIQGSQLNDIDSTFQTDLSANATASCAGGGDFLVYYVFSNGTTPTGLSAASAITALGIDDGVGNGQPDIAIALSLQNQTSVSGVIGGLTGETITFSGNTTGGTTGLSTFEDTGDLHLTVICQSGNTPTLTPAP